ncbi:MAG: DUF2163 domain-containing protein [Pseudomonadota bacterium]
MTELIKSLHTTCQCWTFSRKDGVAVRLTEHDNLLEIDGETYSPGALIEASRFTLTSDLTPGTSEVSGALESKLFDEGDMISGVWDGARVDVFRADWKTATRVAHIWSGRLSRIEHDGFQFSVALVSLKSDFANLLGRAYTRHCDAILGDARCGVDLANPAYTGAICDQRIETCRDRFSNAENFRGFPHMPGSDFLLAGPEAERHR